MLFNFQTFGIFFIVLVFLGDLDLIPLWSEFCFLFQHLVCLSNHRMCSWKEYVFYSCWAEGSININLIKLVENVFHVFCMFTYGTIYWKRVLNTSIEIVVYLYRLLVLNVFVSGILKLLLGICIYFILHYLLDELILNIIIKRSSLSLVVPFALKSTLSVINRATPGFVFLSTLLLYIRGFDLRYPFCKWHRVRSCFFIHSEMPTS